MVDEQYCRNLNTLKLIWEEFEKQGKTKELLVIKDGNYCPVLEYILNHSSAEGIEYLAEKIDAQGLLSEAFAASLNQLGIEQSIKNRPLAEKQAIFTVAQKLIKRGDLSEEKFLQSVKNSFERNATMSGYLDNQNNLDILIAVGNSLSEQAAYNIEKTIAKHTPSLVIKTIDHQGAITEKPVKKLNPNPTPR